MFIAPYNENENIEEIRDFVQNNGFGILIIEAIYETTNKLVAACIL